MHARLNQIHEFYVAGHNLSGYDGLRRERRCNVRGRLYNASSYVQMTIILTNYPKICKSGVTCGNITRSVVIWVEWICPNSIKVGIPIYFPIART